MEPTVKLQVEVNIEKGRGYVQAEENKNQENPLDNPPEGVVTEQVFPTR